MDIFSSIQPASDANMALKHVHTRMLVLVATMIIFYKIPNATVVAMVALLV